MLANGDEGQYEIISATLLVTPPLQRAFPAQSPTPTSSATNSNCAPSAPHPRPPPPTPMPTSPPPPKPPDITTQERQDDGARTPPLIPTSPPSSAQYLTSKPAPLTDSPSVKIRARKPKTHQQTEASTTCESKRRGRTWLRSP
ncbi:hypothetical protein OSTOST_00525 [Ostertagia ostertagi]